MARKKGAVSSHVERIVLTFRIGFWFDRNSKCLIRMIWWKLCLCVCWCVFTCVVYSVCAWSLQYIKVVRWRTCRLMSSRTVSFFKISHMEHICYVCLRVYVYVWAMLWGVRSHRNRVLSDIWAVKFENCFDYSLWPVRNAHSLTRTHAHVSYLFRSQFINNWNRPMIESVWNFRWADWNFKMESPSIVIYSIAIYAELTQSMCAVRLYLRSMGQTNRRADEWKKAEWKPTIMKWNTHSNTINHARTHM